MSFPTRHDKEQIAPCLHLYHDAIGACLDCGALVVATPEERGLDLCIYCTERPTEPRYWPYCGAICAHDADRG